MPAKNYILAVSPVFGYVYIAKPHKQSPGLMTSDRVRVETSTFIDCILEWTKNQLLDGNDTLFITEKGVVVAQIKIIETEKDPTQLNLFDK